VRKTLNVPSELRSQMERRRENIEEKADEAIESALRRLRIPSRSDIDRINARLDKIAAQLKKLGAGEPAKTRTPPRKRRVSR
jgi:polyhydroxyalkanoate synthesis regulator phasin